MWAAGVAGEKIAVDVREGLVTSIEIDVDKKKGYWMKIITTDYERILEKQPTEQTQRD